MANIKLTGNASGTGTLTIAAPNTNVDRTINIPDTAGNIVTTGDSGTITAGMLNSNYYESGTFTPVISGTSGASGQSYSTQGASYVKNGDLVFVQGRMTLTNKGTLSGGSTVISGLPFTIDNTDGRGGNFSFNAWENITGSSYSIKSYGSNSTTYIVLTEGTTGNSVAHGDISNTTQIDFAGVYRTV